PCSALPDYASPTTAPHAIRGSRTIGVASPCAFITEGVGTRSRCPPAAMPSIDEGKVMNEPVILVPLDGTEQALAAMPVAKVLSQIGHMTIRGLHVADTRLRGTELRQILAHGTPVLDEVAIDARAGSPASEILQAARDLDSR